MSVHVAVVISSLIAGIITFLITCIVMRKRQKTFNTSLQSPGGGPVYDTPQWNIKDLHVETNKAYGQIKS